MFLADTLYDCDKIVLIELAIRVWSYGYSDRRIEVRECYAIRQMKDQESKTVLASIVNFQSRPRRKDIFGLQQ